MKTVVPTCWLFCCAFSLFWDVQGYNPEDVQHIVHTTGNIFSRSSALIILFDETNERTASDIRITDGLNQRYRIRDMRRFLYHHIDAVLNEATSIVDIRNRLQFIVLCTDCVDDMFSSAFDADCLVGHQVLRHFSKWLFITQNDVAVPETLIDNVAWINLVSINVTESKGELLFSELWTLLWVPVGRVWSKISLSGMKDRTALYHVFPNIQKGLNGRCLVIAALQWIPESIRSLVNGRVTYIGATIDYIHFLAQVFNFTYRFLEPEDGSWGEKIDNGSWTGIIGMIERNEVDMTGSPYALSPSRVEIMDFTPQMDWTEFVVIYSRRRNTYYFWTFWFRSFSWEIYLCGAATFLVCVLLYACMSQITGCRSASLHSKTDLVFAFAQVAIRQNLPSVCQPRASPERVLIFSWCCFSFLITAIYSGRLVASATVDRLELPFNSLQELAQQNEYTVSTFEGIVVMEILKNSKHMVYQKLYQKLEGHIIKTSSDYLTEGLHQILENRYAIIANVASYDAMKSNSCEIHIMKERLFSVAVSLGFPQRSPLKQLFHETCRWMIDTGVAEERKKRWRPAPKHCDHDREMTNQFKLQHLQAAFAVCLCGAISAGVALLTERLHGLM